MDKLRLISISKNIYLMEGVSWAVYLNLEIPVT